MAEEQLRFTISLKDAMSESVKQIRRELESATGAVHEMASATDSKQFSGLGDAEKGAERAGDAAAKASTSVSQLAGAQSKAADAASSAAAQMSDGFEGAGRAARDVVDPIESIPDAAEKAGREAADAISDPLEEVPEKADRAGRSAGSKFGAAFKTLIGPLLAGISITATVKVATDAAMQEQQSGLVLEGLYGSAEKARETLELLKDVASTSALDFSGYASAAESLAYAGVEGQQAADVLQNVGAAITAAGGDTEGLNRATDAILKGVNAGKFQLDTLQQLSDAGVPILSGLADHLGVTIEEVNALASSGAIGLEDVLAVMEDASGDTFKSMIAASEGATGSLANQWAMAKDAVSVALGEVMLPLIEEIAPKIGPAAEALSGFITGIPEAFEWVEDNIAWLGTLAATIAVAGTASWIASGGLTALGVSIKGVFLAISTGIKSIPVIGWVIAAIGLLVTALTWFFTQTETGKQWWDTIWSGIKVAVDAVVTWFQNTALPILAGVWGWIQTAAEAVVTWFQTTALPILSAVWEGISAGVTWMWENVLKPTWDALQIAFLVVATAIGLYWEFVLKPVFNAIATVAVWLWENVLQPAWAGMQAGWSLLVTAIKWAWENILLPAWNALQAAATWMWENVLSPVFGWIKAGFQTMADGIQWVWLNLIKPAWDGIVSAGQNMWDKLSPLFEKIKEGIRKVGDGFNLARDVIGDAWQSIKDKAKGPTEFIVDTVYNQGIRKVWNGAAGIFKMEDKKLPEVKFATGGVAKGPGTGTSDSINARISNGEFIVNAAATRRHLPLLHAINGPRGVGYNSTLHHQVSTDGVPAFASGGTLMDAADWWLARGARGGRHSRFEGYVVKSGHSRNSLHYQDRAVDFNYGPGGQNATEMAFFDRHLAAFKQAFPHIRTIWRAPGHYNHLHIDTGRGGDIGEFTSGGGGFGFDMSPLTDLLEKVTGFKHESGLWGDGIKNAGKTLVQAPIDFITDKLSVVGDFAQDVGEAVSNRVAKERVRMVAMQYGWGFGEQWDALVKLVQGESSWNPKAANPTTSARGLFQKMTSLHGPIERTVEGQAKWGLDYIKRSYGSPLAAYNKWLSRSPHWYADGGQALVSPGSISTQLFDNGGMWAPGTFGLNLSGSHEQVLTSHQSEILTTGLKQMAYASSGEGRAGSPVEVTVVIQGDVYGMDDFEDKVDEAARESFAAMIREWEERS